MSLSIFCTIQRRLLVRSNEHTLILWRPLNAAPELRVAKELGGATKRAAKELKLERRQVPRETPTFFNVPLALVSSSQFSSSCGLTFFATLLPISGSPFVPDPTQKARGKKSASGASCKQTLVGEADEVKKVDQRTESIYKRRINRLCIFSPFFASFSSLRASLFHFRLQCISLFCEHVTLFRRRRPDKQKLKELARLDLHAPLSRPTEASAARNVGRWLRATFQKRFLCSC